MTSVLFFAKKARGKTDIDARKHLNLWKLISEKQPVLFHLLLLIFYFVCKVQPRWVRVIMRLGLYDV